MVELITDPEAVAQDLKKMSNFNLMKLLDSEGLRESSDELHKVDESPIDINAFLDEGKYLGNYFDGQFLSDRNNYWRMFLNEIYPDVYDSPYWLCCLKGSIGSGKTTTACAGMVYDAYRLLCLGDPQRTLGVIPTDKIEFAIFNVTLTLAINVVWDKISQMFTSSEYFNNLLGVSRRKHREDSLFPKRIDFYSGSRVGHSLGHSVYEVAIDEANFEVLTGQVRKNFYSLLRRMETRYMSLGGGFPGKIWIISSETDKSSVLNQIIEEYRGKKGVIVRQPALWEVKSERYDKTKKRFKVFRGTELRSPVILDETNEKEYKNEEENIILVPQEHRDSFEASIHDSLRDLAGISTGTSYKLFRMKEKLNIAMCVDLLFPDVFELDFHDDTDQISNKVLIPKYFKKIFSPEYPRYIHIDVGLTGDRLGLGCTYVSQYKERTRISITDLKKITEMVPELVTEFAFAIQAKGGHPIPLFKVRAFILWLSGLGYTFGMISADGYECFTGDTRISLLNGTEVEIKDLVGEDEFWVYSCTPDGNVVPGKGHSARKIGVRPVVKITLDNGETIKCTADHRFMIRDGSYKEAQYLIPEDSLMPLYRKVEQSYERFWDNKTNRWNVTHIRVAKEIYPNYKPSKYKDPNGNKVHHRNFNKLDNSPENLLVCSKQSVHSKFHIDLERSSKVMINLWNQEWFREKRSGEVSEQLIRQWKNPEYREKMISNLKPWDQVFREFPEVMEKNKERGRRICTNYDTHPRVLRWLTPELVFETVKEVGSMKKAAEILGINKETARKRLEPYLDKLEFNYKQKGGKKSSELMNANPEVYKKRCISNLRRYGYNEEYINQRVEELTQTKYNHKIVKIEDAGYEDVYDISVDNYNNFALTSGVFVHNSADLLMMMHKLGFATEELSVDKTSLPYLKLRTNVYEELVYLPASKLLRKELDNLESTPDGSKVDHPEKFSDGTRGSKDIADGVCGSQASALRTSDKYKMIYFHPEERGAVSSQMRETFWPQGVQTGN